jgi:hypothetical protein
MIAVSIGMLDCAEYLMVRLAKKPGQLTKHIAASNKLRSRQDIVPLAALSIIPEVWANETTGPAFQPSLRWETGQ